MHPEICQIGPFIVYSYGVMLALAFVTSSYLVMGQAKKEGLDTKVVFNLIFFVFISGIVGARILYILGHWDYFLQNPREIIMLQHGGLSWFGGLLSGSIFAVAYLKAKKLPILKTFDLVSPFIALAQAIGRVGCLLNGCCYGKESAWGIYFPVHDAVLIPTQVFSSLLLILIFIILRFIQDRPHRAGEIFFVYLMLYSLKRFFVEFFRGDTQFFFFGLTFFQTFSIITLMIAITGFLFIKARPNKG